MSAYSSISVSRDAVIKHINQNLNDLSNYNRFPTCYPTVDIAIVDNEKNKLLLCRKPNVEKYQFVGGFADPTSESYEADAKRETREETGLEVSNIKYIGSAIIDDWRYRSEVDKIKTLFFTADYVFGKPNPQDDICELKWFDINDSIVEHVANGHQNLIKMFLKNYKVSTIIKGNAGMICISGICHDGQIGTPNFGSGGQFLKYNIEDLK